jgi:hypothetical protein
MRTKKVILSGFLCLPLVLWAQESQKRDGPKAPDWKPTKEHQLLKQFEGEWEYRSRCMMPGQEPQEGRGTETDRLAYGGFWLHLENKGTAMGKEYSGTGLIGYDPKRMKYVGVWADNFMPFLGRFEGDADLSGKILTFKMLGEDPHTGQAQSGWMKFEFKSPDHRVLSFYGKDQAGKEQLMSEMTFTRKGGTLR